MVFNTNKLQSVSLNLLQTFVEKNYGFTGYVAIMASIITSLTIIIWYRLSNMKYSIRQNPYTKARTT